MNRASLATVASAETAIRGLMTQVWGRMQQDPAFQGYPFEKWLGVAIDLKGVGLTDQEACNFFDALAQHPDLKVHGVDLSNNELTDATAIKVADALKSNTWLGHRGYNRWPANTCVVSVDNNPITKTAAEAIVRAKVESGKGQQCCSMSDIQVSDAEWEELLEVPGADTLLQNFQLASAAWASH